MKRGLVRTTSILTRPSAWRNCPIALVNNINSIVINTNNTQSRNKTIEANRKVDFSWGQNRKAALKHTYLTVEQSKEAVNDLKNALETNYKTDIENISSMCKFLL